MTITSITPTARATGSTSTAKLNLSQTLISSSSIPIKGCCSNCGGGGAPFLHYVRIRDTPRRLCTSCVLRLHPASFCPSCLAFFGDSLPHPSKRISCSSCSSYTHSHCASPAAAGGVLDPFLPSYLCPPCKDSSFSFFPLKENNNKIDKKLALALLCAAKIASSSMGKAAAKAWADAHERAREAALARKRAKEAIEHLLHVTRKEKAARMNQALHPNLATTDMDMDMDMDDDGDVDAELVRQLEDSHGHGY